MRDREALRARTASLIAISETPGFRYHRKNSYGRPPDGSSCRAWVTAQIIMPELVVYGSPRATWCMRGPMTEERLVLTELLDKAGEAIRAVGEAD